MAGGGGDTAYSITVNGVSMLLTGEWAVRATDSGYVDVVEISF